MHLSSSDTKDCCIYSCLLISLKENWFQYVRWEYSTAINFPCLITLGVHTLLEDFGNWTGNIFPVVLKFSEVIEKPLIFVGPNSNEGKLIFWKDTIPDKFLFSFRLNWERRRPNCTVTRSLTSSWPMVLRRQLRR